MRGEIKRIKPEEGYGFILGEDGVDYFFHKSCLAPTCPVALEQMNVRMPVTFTPETSLRGPRATDVTVEH